MPSEKNEVQSYKIVVFGNGDVVRYKYNEQNDCLGYELQRKTGLKNIFLTEENEYSGKIKYGIAVYGKNDYVKEQYNTKHEMYQSFAVLLRCAKLANTKRQRKIDTLSTMPSLTAKKRYIRALKMQNER